MAREIKLSIAEPCPLRGERGYTWLETLWSAGRILMGGSCRKSVGWLSPSYRPGSFIKLAERDLCLFKIFYFPREKDRGPAICISPPETKRAQAVKKSSVIYGCQGSGEHCHEVPKAHKGT